MAMTKVGKLKLETSAYYQQKQDTKIAFYNTDENTSILRFIVTRNNDVLPLGKVNTDVMIHLTAEDGSWVIDDVGVTDELNGICEYQIPNGFLNHTGKVNGQVYISVDRKEDTVTEVEFSFTIKDASINKTPAVDKIFYIRKYSELEYRLKEKVQNIEDAYKNIDDYVTKVNKASEDGIKSLNDTKNSALLELKDSKELSINGINTTVQNQLEILNDKSNEVSSMISDFKQQVDSNLFVQKADTDNWQKYNLTNSDGTRKVITELKENVANLPAGAYTTTIPADTTIARTPKNIGNENTAYHAFIDVSHDTSNQKVIYITNTDTGILFIKVIQSDGSDKGWKKVGQLFEDDQLLSEKYLTESLSAYDNDLKTFISSTYKKKNKQLFSGDARARGSVYSIGESYKNFSYLLVRYRFSGGGKMVPAYIDTDKKIPIQDFNMTDSAGDNPKMVEMGLIFNTDTEFKVTHNNSFDVKKSTAMYDDNNIVVVEIVGVY
ncbi:hypothetical protein BJG88_10195 [Staphylococcus nepalensis]|uniref:BppU family phage baseplate upper protein n=1 Tax=Staphylococcus nepalensis TaxID=214473 RepID=UPI000D589B41|nr:BppU family phage baseplate upper protein [Staphylococcus nepalensis]AWI44795.1 hypothetical protein BJG88_08605 [Staphylococcus nepalensis]AWI45083.1 hypothetical protein BJG88_10195 [Staphylococcus nepalensis]